MARTALDLYVAHRPKVPVVALIYTHSHGDHDDGGRGVMAFGPPDDRSQTRQPCVKQSYLVAMTPKAGRPPNATRKP